MEELVKITLLGQEIPLTPPESYSMRWEISTAVAKNRMRALGAALGCSIRPQDWPIRDAAGKPRRRPVYGYEPLPFGGQVIDALTGAGAQMSEIIAAGTHAFLAISQGIFAEEEVKAHEDFSVAGGEPPAP